MGYGDDIMASAEARALARTRPDAKIVVGDGEREFWSEIFERNPNITSLSDVKDGDEIVWLRNHYGSRPYLNYPVVAEYQTFRPYRAAPGDLFPSPAERRLAFGFLLGLPRDKPLIYVEPNTDYGVCKDWGFHRYQEVVRQLKSDVTFVQADYGKRMLVGVSSFPSRSFLAASAVLAGCDLYLGPEGGMHHAAAAMGRPGVVIFGGRISPEITGYDFHLNLYVDMEGSPCGSIAPCPHCEACFNHISVDEVIDSLMSVLGVSTDPR